MKPPTGAKGNTMLKLMNRCKTHCAQQLYHADNIQWTQTKQEVPSKR